MNKHTNVGMRVYKYTCMHLSTCKHKCEYTHIYKELYIYIYIYIHNDVYINIDANAQHTHTH